MPPASPLRNRNDAAAAAATATVAAGEQTATLLIDKSARVVIRRYDSLADVRSFLKSNSSSGTNNANGSATSGTMSHRQHQQQQQEYEGAEYCFTINGVKIPPMQERRKCAWDLLDKELGTIHDAVVEEGSHIIAGDGPRKGRLTTGTKRLKHVHERDNVREASAFVQDVVGGGIPSSGRRYDNDTDDDGGATGGGGTEPAAFVTQSQPRPSGYSQSQMQMQIQSQSPSHSQSHSQLMQSSEEGMPQTQHEQSQELRNTIGLHTDNSLHYNGKEDQILAARHDSEASRSRSDNAAADGYHDEDDDGDDDDATKTYSIPGTDHIGGEEDDGEDDTIPAVSVTQSQRTDSNAKKKKKRKRGAARTTSTTEEQEPVQVSQSQDSSSRSQQVTPTTTTTTQQPQDGLTHDEMCRLKKLCRKPPHKNQLMEESGQTDDDRRLMRKALRRQQRRITNSVQGDQIEDPDHDAFEQVRNRNNFLYNGVRFAREAVVDADNVEYFSERAARQTDKLVHVPRYDTDRLIRKLQSKLTGRQGSSSYFDWRTLGREVGVCFNAVPSRVAFLNGPDRVAYVPKERKLRARRAFDEDDEEEDETPDELKHKNGGAGSDKLSAVERNIATVNKVLNKKSQAAYTHSVAALDADATLNEDERKREKKKLKTKGYEIGAVQHLFNPKSFTQTVENIFHFSFLVKKGSAGISVRSEEDAAAEVGSGPGPGPVVRAVPPPLDSSEKKPPPKQAIVSLNMRDWRDMCEAFEVQESDIPHRDGGSSTSRKG